MITLQSLVSKSKQDFNLALAPWAMLRAEALQVNLSMTPATGFVVPSHTCLAVYLIPLVR
jgi:hypothetical protein